MNDTTMIERLNHRSIHTISGYTSAPGPQVGWIQLREKGPLFRLYETARGCFYYWSVTSARFLPIAKDRLPEILHL